VIYFAQSIEGGPVKIGATDDVARRLGQLEAHYGRPLALLATLPGGRDEEAEIHERFAHLRLGRTEQFRPAAELMKFINRPLLVGANPDAVEAMDVGCMVKFDRILAAKARQVALARGITMTAYLSDLSRGQIDRDYAKVLRELEGGKE
jgi:hypothetical protein